MTVILIRTAILPALCSNTEREGDALLRHLPFLASADCPDAHSAKSYRNPDVQRLFFHLENAVRLLAIRLQT